MSSEPFLREYLYGRSAEERRVGPHPGEPQAIAGRRAPVHLAGQLGQIMKGVVSEVLEPHGLTPPHWGVMVAIAREPGTDQRRVCERQSMDPNSASRLIDELEEMGLVRRVPSATDRRANRLEFTDKGRRLRQKLRGPILEAQDRVLAPLEREEKHLLLQLLTRVVEANRTYAKPGNGRRRPSKSGRPILNAQGH
jgi:DNA-binding MarR family transcriptional regulator